MTKRTGNRPRTIRNNNLKLMLNLYGEQKALSVSEIASRINLSRTTVSKINEKLLALNLVAACGKGDSTDEGGKKPELYCLNRRFGHIICFHIIEGFINVKIFDLSLSIIKKEKILTRDDESLENIISVIGNKVEEYLSDSASDEETQTNADYKTAAGSARDEKNNRGSRLLGISVAVHGIIDSEKGVCYTAPHFPSWGSNRNIKKMIIEKLGPSITVHVDSWIRFKAYSAKIEGDVPVYKNYVLLDAGQHGIVSGVVINGELFSGHRYLSGEIGHTIVSATDIKQCYCGGKGCLETFIDCRSLVAKAVSMKKRYPDSLIFKNNHDIPNPDIFDVFRASNHKDELACLLMDEAAGWFAIGLSNVFLMFDPEVIYFEGDYSNAGDYFVKRLNEKINSVSLNGLEKNFRIIFQDSRHSMTMLGAAAFARDYYLFNKIEA